MDGAQRDAYGGLVYLLNQMGLGSIANKAWDWVVEYGQPTADQMLLWIRDQPEYKTRFPAMNSLVQKGRRITEQEYVQLERTYASVMRQYGVATYLYDDESDFARLIENEVRPDEFAERIEKGYAAVANADPTVRRAFEQYFGVRGDQALASFFLDPNKATPKLLEAARVAEIAGAAQSAGLAVSIDYASELARKGVTYDDALKGMGQVAQMRDLFETGAQEAAITPTVAAYSDLRHVAAPGARGGQHEARRTGTRADEMVGMEAVFGTDPNAERELQRRLAQRRSEFGQTSSGAVVDERGHGGVGSAD